MQRKSNFELLRIAAMLLIIGSHLASHGIQHVLGGAETYHIWMEGSNLNRGFVALLTPGGTVGAALFFMITGYFRVNKEEIKVVGIILESLFYGMLIVLFTLIIIIWDLPVPGLEMKEMVSFSIMAVLNPASSGIWWFISAYLLLLFLLPVINKLLLSLNKKKYLFFIGAFWVVWYTIASLGSQYIYLERAIFFYVLGAYCRLHLKKTGRKLIYGVIAAVSWIVGSFLQYASACLSLMDISTSMVILILKYTLSLLFTAIIIPTVSFSIFRVFESFDMKYNEKINCFGRGTFGVYMLHDSTIGRPFIWYVLLKTDTVQYQSVFFPIYALLSIIGVFVICTLIDLIRARWMEPIMMKAYYCIKKRVGNVLS